MRLARDLVPLTLALCLLGACGCAPSRVKQATPQFVELTGESVTLPTRDAGPLYLVDARIDGKGPYTLILDTGLYGLVLSSRAHREVNLEDPRSRRVETLQIGGFTAHDFTYRVDDFPALEKALGTSIDGIAGYRVFYHVVLVVDYPARRVLVSEVDLDPEDETVVRYHNGPYRRPWLPIEIGSYRNRVLVDIGSTGGILLPDLDDIALERPPVAAGTIVHRGGELELLSARAFDAAEIGPLTILNPRLGEAPGFPKIGAAALEKFIVSFDQYQRLIRLDYEGLP